MNNINLLYNKKLVVLILYFTLLISFLLNENSSGGSQKDYLYTYKYIIAISENLIDGIKLIASEHPQHFPLNYLLLGTLLKFLKEPYMAKFIFLHISLIIPFVFYKCIKIVHKNKEVSFLLSIILFLSPYYRSSAVWSTTDNLATLFFISSIFFYLKFEFFKKKILNIYLLIFFLFLAFYTRQYYILYSIFFFLKIYKNKLFIKNLSKIIILIIVLSGPASIYIFNYYLPRMGGLTFYYSKNFVNNFFISISIISFYLMPFLIFSKNNTYLFFLFFKKKLFHNLIIIILFLCLSYFFNYNLNPHGGGIIYKFFNSFVGLKIFFLFCSFSMIMLIFFFKENIVNNLTLFLIIFLSFYFYTIFQKYFDPLLIILFTTLFKSKLINNEIKNMKKKIFFYFFYFTIFYCISLIYNY